MRIAVPWGAEVEVRFDECRLADLPISGQFGNGGGFRDDGGNRRIFLSLKHLS